MECDFVTWLTYEMERRGWSNSELARRAGMVPSAVSQIISGTRSPGYEFCIKIARPLDQLPETVLRRAGLLPRLPETAMDSTTIQRLTEIIRNLPEDSQRELLEIALILLRRETD